VRVVAGLMPKEMQATVTTVHLERMSDDQLLEIIRQSGLDPAATDEDAQIIQ